MISDKGADFIIDRLNSFGYEAYYVGGCVRNYLLNIPIIDYDLTTNALPNIILDVFSDCKIIKTGLKHGTVGVVIDNVVYEVTTYRTESSYSDFRHPNNVTFCKSVHDDLSRRDFTINAIIYHKNTGFIDDYGGIYDTRNRILKCVNDPNVRFEEDALRILRALRFASEYTLTIEENTKHAIMDKYFLLRKISAERITSEFIKILLGDNVVFILNKFKQIFEFIFHSSIDASMFGVLELLPKKDYLRIAFFSTLLKENDFFFSYLKISKEIKRVIFLLIENKYFSDFLNKTCIKRLMNLVNDIIFDFISIKKSIAVYTNNLDLIGLIDCFEYLVKEIISNNECYQIKNLQVDGNDLIALGYSGSEIKCALNRVLDAVISEKILNDKKEIIKFLNG